MATGRVRRTTDVRTVAGGLEETGRILDWVRVPGSKEVERLVRETARLVADLPVTSNRDVVWQAGASELLVRTDRLTVAVTTGLVSIGIPVSCDQLREEATVTVPLAVGTAQEVRGLFMSTFGTPEGPSVVTDVWAESLTAFAWESLLTLAQQLAAQAGRDPRNRPLVPVAIAAERGVLLVAPMARQE